MNSEVYDEIKASLRVIKWMVGFVLAFVVHQLLHSSPPTTAAPIPIMPSLPAIIALHLRPLQ